MLEKVNQEKVHIYVEYIILTHWENSKASNEPRAFTYFLSHVKLCGITI